MRRRRRAPRGGDRDGGGEGEGEGKGIDDPCREEQALGGDFLYLRFEGDPVVVDELTSTSMWIIRDFSGARRDAAGYNVTGRPSSDPMHGDAAVLDEGAYIALPEPPEIAGQGRLTIEAWVGSDDLDGTAVILGDLSTNAEIASELTFALQDGLPVLMSNADGAPVTVAAEPPAALAAGEWAHVATACPGGTCNIGGVCLPADPSPNDAYLYARWAPRSQLQALLGRYRANHALREAPQDCADDLRAHPRDAASGTPSSSIRATLHSS